MKLIVGLGNPGREYNNTRHNIGFMVIDNYLKKFNTICRKKFDGMYYEVIINNEKTLFLKPLKYMNLSGEVIRKYIDYYNIDIDDVLIINDDLDLNIGNFKLKSSGSSGGHNGLKNIELHLNTNKYKRLKIGISNNKNIDTKDYVLGKLSKIEEEEINKVIKFTEEILDDFFLISFNDLMAKYNRKQ